MRNPLGAALDRLRRGAGSDAAEPVDRGEAVDGEGAEPPAGGGDRPAEGDDAATPRERLLGTTRRGMLARVAGVAGAAGGFRAVDNVLLGYGVLVGTNLRAQQLTPLFTDSLTFTDRRYPLADGRHLAYSEGTLAVERGERRLAAVDVFEATPAEASGFDARHDLPGAPGPAEELARDLGAIRAGELTVEPLELDAFFERARAAETRPYAVGPLRGPFHDHVAPETVAGFTDADPADPAATVEGLATAFREHTDYDLPRYVAGSVEDNLLGGAVDLRRHFESDVEYGAVGDGGHTGLFCYEYARRAAEAFHALAPTRQRLPVAAAEVIDDRHKHVYSSLTTLVRDEGDLRLLATFLDYTHVAMYDDAAAQRVMGEGLEAYDRRHRATEVKWY